CKSIGRYAFCGRPDARRNRGALTRVRTTSRCQHREEIPLPLGESRVRVSTKSRIATESGGTMKKTYSTVLLFATIVFGSSTLLAQSRVRDSMIVSTEWLAKHL